MRRMSFYGFAGLVLTLSLSSCGGKSDSTTTTSVAPVSPTSAASESGSTTSLTSGSTSAIAAVKVSAKNLAYVPSTFSVKVNEQFSFRNDDTDFSHTFTLDDGSVGTTTMIPGQTSPAIKIGVAGEHKFHCSIHASMTGTVTVTE